MGGLLDMARVRLANQQITVHTSTTPREVVISLGAIQAQDYPSALWAVGLRLPGAGATDIERALHDLSIVRTWALRGTLHFLAAEDVRWVLGLLAPRIIAASAYRRGQLEIDDLTLARSRALLDRALSGGRVLARNEAMHALESAGIKTGGQRGIHILRHLSLEGQLCQVAHKGRQSTFALLDGRVPDSKPIDRDEALGRLASRYFGGHGPATLRDFAWWSGLTLADARVGLESAKDRLSSEEVGAAMYWMPPTRIASEQSGPVVKVIPAFDEYVLGYANRGVALDAIASQRVVPGGNGVFRPTIIVQGRVVGTWRMGTEKRASSVAELFSPLDASLSEALTLVLREYDEFVKRPTGTNLETRFRVVTTG